jgi:hypothetical protein
LNKIFLNTLDNTVARGGCRMACRAGALTRFDLPGFPGTEKKLSDFGFRGHYLMNDRNE